MRRSLPMLVAAVGSAAGFTTANAQTAQWLLTGGGNFNDPGAWSIGAVPGASSDLLFDLGGETPYTVALDSGWFVNSIEVNASRPTLDMNSDTLALVDAANPLRLGMIDGGVDAHLTIANGVLQTSASVIEWTASTDVFPVLTLDNATWITDATFDLGRNPASGDAGTRPAIHVLNGSTLEFGATGAESRIVRSSLVVGGEGSLLKVHGSLNGFNGAANVTGSVHVLDGARAELETLRASGIGVRGVGSLLEVETIARSSSGFVEDGGVLAVDTMNMGVVMGDFLPIPGGVWRVEDAGSRLEADSLFIDGGSLDIGGGGVVATQTVNDAITSVAPTPVSIVGEGSRFESGSSYFARSLDIGVFDGGTLAAPSITLAGGFPFQGSTLRTARIHGNGVVDANLVVGHNSIIEQSDGTLAITGDLTMFGIEEGDEEEGFLDPILRVLLGVPNLTQAYVSVGGVVTLAGNLILSSPSGSAAPDVGDFFVLIEAVQIVGSFTNDPPYQYPLGPGKRWLLQYLPDTLIARVESTCPADFNADGAVDGGDLGLLLLSWGACPSECPWDMNYDGVVDGGDLGILLLAWGPCP